MLKAVKESVHRMTSHLQLISGYLEMKDYTKALGKTKENIKELHALATSLTGLGNAGMTVPKDGAVVGWPTTPISEWPRSGSSRRSE